MRRVYTIYYARQLARPAPRVALLVVLGTALFASVSVVSVAQNLLAVRGLPQLYAFVVEAFVGATPFVQAVTAGIAGLVSWFSYDTITKVKRTILPPATDPALVQ